MRVAELGRPRQVEEIVVKGLRVRVRKSRRRVWTWRRLRRGAWMRLAASAEKKDEEEWRGFLLHGGRRIARDLGGRQRSTDALLGTMPHLRPPMWPQVSSLE